MTRRTARRGIAGSVLVVLGLVIGAVVVTALQAEGRERSRGRTPTTAGPGCSSATSATSATSTAPSARSRRRSAPPSPGSDYDVDQAHGVIVVHDRTAGTLELVDDAPSASPTPSRLQRRRRDVTVHAVDGGALVVDRGSMAVWKLDRDALAVARDARRRRADPARRGRQPSPRRRPTATPCSSTRPPTRSSSCAPTARPDTSPALDLTDDSRVAHVRSATTPPCSPTPTATCSWPRPTRSRRSTSASPAPTAPRPLILQQPGRDADHVVARHAPTGAIVAAPAAPAGRARPRSPSSARHGRRWRRSSTAAACSPCRRRRPTFAQWCAGAAGRPRSSTRRSTAPASELRLRLVNGWVWINDVDTGAAWVTSPQQRLDRVEDWGSDPVRAQRRQPTTTNTDDDGGEVIEEIDPDDPNAEIVESDEIDEDGPNRPPIARDDETQTRVDRPIDVDVLANDTDPERRRARSSPPSSQTGGDAVVDDQPRRRAACRSRRPPATPAPSRSATRSPTVATASASAAVSPSQVTASDGSDNRPPEAHNDIASTRQGRPTTFDVLANDVDPDGDALVLESIALADPATTRRRARARPVGPGGVHARPEQHVGAHRADVRRSATTSAPPTRARSSCRSACRTPTTSPTPATTPASPSSASRCASTSSHNDTDPDNDPLFIAQLPTLVRPEDQTADALDLSLTPDGELFFNPAAAGTYVFNYSATDGEETDVAQIRVEVSEPAENRPPIAVRDDVVIPAGGSRLVYVLANDGDPDGDVVGLVGHTADDGLTVKEVDGVGYLVTVAPDAPARDRRSATRSPTAGPTRSAPSWSSPSPTASSLDQPPVARTDVVEVRAGGKVAVPVLANDYDPEGGALEVVVGHRRPTAPRPRPGSTARPSTSASAPSVVSSFTLSYTVADEAGNQSSAFIEVRIVPADEVNRPPIARTDLARTRSGVPVAIEVVANDTDPDGDIIAVENVRSPADAAAPPASTAGAVVYTPSDTFTGTDRFTYALVDANGEIAIGEVLVGVMPLRRRRTGRRRRSTTASRSSPAAPRSCSTSSTTTPTPTATASSSPRSARRRRGATAVADGGGAVMFTPPPSTSPARRSPAEVAFTLLDRRRPRRHGVGDGRRCASSPPPTPIAADRRRRPDRPGDRRARRSRSTCSPTTSTRTATRPSSSCRPATRRCGSRDGGVVTFTAGRRRAATATRSPTRPGSPTPPSSPCSSSTTGPRRRAAHGRDARQRADRRSTSPRQASDPDGDTLFFACCDSARGGAATTGRQRRRRAHRGVRPRRRLRRAGDVLLHRRRPEGPHRRRRGDGQRARRRATARRRRPTRRSTSRPA